MEFERRLRKVARYHIALFLLPLVSLLFYGWWNAATLNARPDNPFQASPLHLRGSLLDRDGRNLASSQGEQRVYPLGRAAAPLIGYHLRGRNQSGLEALLQSSLSPPPPPKSLWGALTADRRRADGTPALQGPSRTLTLDSPLQAQIYELFSQHHGALVVARADSGQVLAAVSSPSFDPNNLARDWQTLRTDPGSPLIERVSGGLYPVLTPEGKPLVPLSDPSQHPWFQENPFPDFPGASPALELDGTQLTSPLMLLHLALPGETLPVLLPPEPGSQPVSSPRPPLEDLPLAERQASIEWTTLQGPAFRDSPPFVAVVGRRPTGKTPLAFAVVVENLSGPQWLPTRKKLFHLLERYP